MWSFCLNEEKKVRLDASQSYDEKNLILLNNTLIKYALNWKINLYAKSKNSSTSNTRAGHSPYDFWSTIACYAGTISTYIGIGTGFSGGNIAGAIVGAATGTVAAIYTCNGTNQNVCQDPLTVSFPYQCYTYGSPLLCTAVGYGNIPPSQFTFDFRYNDDLNNYLWSNFGTSNSIYIPGNYLTANITDIAVQCKTNCSNGNPLWFGWFNLSDLGKPYFTISGPSQISVADVSYYNYRGFTYEATGPINKTNAIISWRIIPYWYSGYSATGSVSGDGFTEANVRWDPHPGFATLECTATVNNCATVTQDYQVQITQ